MEAVDEIVNCFRAAGAQAKTSSIHVNGWFGEYDKLVMTRMLFKEVFNVSLEKIKDQLIFTGDSPNDAPLFAYFPHSVGVANVKRFKKQLACEPSWITQKEGGDGFAEMVDTLLA